MSLLGDGTTARHGGGPPLPGPGGLPVVYERPPAESRAAAGAARPERPPVPRLSAGLQLHGEYQGSGFTEPKYIARRGDGQVVQLSRLLYLVAQSVDGVRDLETVAHRVSARYGREVSTDNVRYLIEEKLTPLGVTVPEGVADEEVSAPRSDLLLALKGHRVLFGEQRVARIARSLAWLHSPTAVALVLAAAVAMDVWFFAFFGAVEPVLEVLDQPVLILVAFALTVASLVFHEFGHASACKYGGARPGCIGCGLFLIWPSLYTDVTDVYRIGRAGRLRTDFGGVYFNVVFMLGMAGAYFATGQVFFLSAVYLGHFEVLEQLMPAVRLDGYYILGDLAGIPDLYGKVRPILLSLVPGRRGRAARREVAGLKRSARVIVATWVLTMVPLLAGELGYGLWNLPRILTTMTRSLTEQLGGTAAAFTTGHLASGLVGVIGSVMLLCPMAGVTYLSVKLAGRLIRAAAQSTAHKPRLRIALCALSLAALTGLSYAWVSGMTPKPLPKQPPIAPVLQPGVPTSRPPLRHTPARRRHPTAPPTPVTPSLRTGSPSAGPRSSAPASPSATSQVSPIPHTTPSKPPAVAGPTKPRASATPSGRPASPPPPTPTSTPPPQSPPPTASPTPAPSPAAT
ncbi:hypothetical protein ACFYZ9_37645 [Streptomyces sp. NPDC001691]|uniref:hypothetical protein n=1 Tax=Streptomyces sp. NPDC001691 TaxID=3364600 RepID=UPI00369C33AE